MPNPFFYGGMITDPRKFFGRKEELRLIFGRLGTTPPQCVSVVGERRIGRSSLLYHLTQAYPQWLANAGRYLFAYLDLQSARCHTRAGLLSNVLEALLSRAELDSASEEGRWLADLRGKAIDLVAFEEALEKMNTLDLRPVLCLDEFENLTVRPQEFGNDFFDSWRSVAQFGHIAFVTASRTPLEFLSRSGKLTSPFFNIFARVPLGELKPDEARALVTQPSDRPFTEEEVRLALRLAEGTAFGYHPFRLQIACSIIYEEKAKGKVDARAIRKAYETAVKPLPWGQKALAFLSRHGRKLVEGVKYLVEIALRWKGK